MTSPTPDGHTNFAPEHLGLDTLVEFMEASLDGIVVIAPNGRYIYANPVACEIMGYPLEEMVGRDLFTNFPERLHQEMQITFQAGLRGVVGRYSSVVLRPDGEEREIEYTNTHFEVDGQTIVSAIFHDVTDLRRQAREAATLADIASTMTVNLSMEETVNALARNVVESTTAMASAVIIVNKEMNRFNVAGTCNLSDGYKPALAEVWPLAPTSVSVMATETKHQQIRHNARERILGLPSYAALHPYVREAEWDTLLATPLVYRGKSSGVLMTFYPPDWVINDDEHAFLKAIADQAAVAIENHRLFHEAQGKAALQERQMLSRELHDSVSQALYGIALGATTARKLLDQEPVDAIQPLEYVLSLAEAGLAEMRALIFELRPESLETEGLVAALEKQAASLRARHRINVDIDLCYEPELPLPVKEMVYRIAQEALQNTVKHAHATSVRLCLENDGTSTLTLRLKDDGIGFDPSDTYDDRRGLRAMRAITSRLGGSLTIESTPGGGTFTRVDIPMPCPEADLTA